MVLATQNPIEQEGTYPLPEAQVDRFMMKLRVDYPTREQRFDVVYHLLSMRKNMRIRLKIMTDEKTPVQSVAKLWPCADWFEREAYDMFGIVFTGHPDLRRLLTDYGFQGHPLRKDYAMGRIPVQFKGAPSSR